MLRLFAAFASVGILLAAEVAQGDDAKEDLEKLHGTWEIVELIADGHTVPADKLKGSQVVFKGDEMTLTQGDAVNDARKFRVKLDPRQKPKAIDMTALNSKYKGSVGAAIYQLEGDTLKLCSPDDPRSKERPTEFKSPKGAQLILLTLKRAKP